MPGNDCPEEMYKTMMDGWSADPDKRFNHQEIFSRLISIKQKPMYEPLETTDASLSDTTSMKSQYSNITENTC